MSAREPGDWAVLFDVDGTLLDTAPDIAAAVNELRRERGLAPLELARVRAFVSHGASALMRVAFPHAPEAEFLALRARLLVLYRAALAVHTRPFAGILELLAQLEHSGTRWGVVTNKPGWLTHPLLEAQHLRERAAVIVSGDTLPQRKPNPEPLLHAARQLGVPVQRCVYVGDAERDVLAARAAGMPVLVVRFGYLAPGENPLEWPADAWVDSAGEILTWLEARRRTSGASASDSRSAEGHQDRLQKSEGRA